MKPLHVCLLVYLLLINAAGFFLMRADKSRAIKNNWRIPEAVLIWASILGGSLGCWLGMYAFHHKTRHKKFTLGVPIILCLQILIGILVAKKVF